MPHQEVDQAFKNYLSAHWTATPVVDINEFSGYKANNTNFMVIQYPVVSGNKPTLGRHYTEEGVARFVLNVDRAIYATDGYLWTGQLASLFRDQKFNGIQTFTPDGPIVNDSVDDGVYIELAILVPYRYQFNDP